MITNTEKDYSAKTEHFDRHAMAALMFRMRCKMAVYKNLLKFIAPLASCDKCSYKDAEEKCKWDHEKYLSCCPLQEAKWKIEEDEEYEKIREEREKSRDCGTCKYMSNSCEGTLVHSEGDDDPNTYTFRCRKNDVDVTMRRSEGWSVKDCKDWDKR